MILQRPVIFFISQTGSEVLTLLKNNPTVCDAIVCHENSRLNIVPELVLKTAIHKISLPNKPTVEDYYRILSNYSNPIVCLSGFLRIIPAEICSEYECYNIHPALITRFPELKGLDKQKDVVNNSLRYPLIGCVIHKVIPELDSGAVLVEEIAENPDKEELVYATLKKLGIKCWERFFESLTISVRPTKGCKAPSTSIIDIVEKKYPETCNEFKRLQQADYLLFCQKQSDYGPGNISLGSPLEQEEDRRISQSSIIFRCFDKIQRLINLVVKNPKTTPTNEPIEDAYADLTNYGIIARIVRNKKWGK
jgi:folate-dependent phosphoribosylglycinamide formyltransferase PurN